MVWDHLPVANLVTAQREAAIGRLDERLAEDYAQGYAVDADRLLDERLRLMRQLREGRI